VPLSDRDYMRSRPSRGYRGRGGPDWFMQNPVLVLIAVNIVFFLATTIQPNLKNLLALEPALFFQRPWTIISNMFVHANFWHIFGNMVTLFFFGQTLKQLVGPNRFLAVYFIGGIIGNIFFILLKYASYTGVIGASGAIYAVAGALVMLVPNLKVMLWFIAPMSLWIVVLLFFVLWSFLPGVAWQAHLGGLAAGLVAGYIFRRSGRYYYLR
jgi:membrane associated rhomboid family serine protease